MSRQGRVARAILLGGELRESMASLAVRTTPVVAAVFLDRLARCEAFEKVERREARIHAVVLPAREVRQREVATLRAALGRGLDSRSQLLLGWTLAEGGSAARAWSWGEDLLLLATITPWLSATQSSEVRETLAQAMGLIQAIPENLADLERLARDRRESEHPGRMLNPSLEAVLVAFAAVRELARDDERVGEPSVRAVALLEDVFSRRVDGKGGPRIREELVALRDQLVARFRCFVAEPAQSYGTPSSLPTTEILFERPGVFSVRREDREIVVMVPAGHRVECVSAVFEDGREVAVRREPPDTLILAPEARALGTVHVRVRADGVELEFSVDLQARV